MPGTRPDKRAVAHGTWPRNGARRGGGEGGCDVGFGGGTATQHRVYVFGVNPLPLRERVAKPGEGHRRSPRRPACISWTLRSGDQPPQPARPAEGEARLGRLGRVVARPGCQLLPATPAIRLKRRPCKTFLHGLPNSVRTVYFSSTPCPVTGRYAALIPRQCRCPDSRRRAIPACGSRSRSADY